ncbi:hypothetical protein K466DRAFT_588695 [Polyporus arcularius HHB13444]|uniref:Uncharacterized protein n=1 Tax=Polyporus arcularius HHB13444 TaxID=1314778 RepID=A0A5C3PFN0_9APHY|nr:hypothetical protein K466DRAFT_588695 [Polyporus arcularius HHB13444]
MSMAASWSIGKNAEGPGKGLRQKLGCLGRRHSDEESRPGQTGSKRRSEQPSVIPVRERVNT